MKYLLLFIPCLALAASRYTQVAPNPVVYADFSD